MKDSKSDLEAKKNLRIFNVPGEIAVIKSLQMSKANSQTISPNTRKRRFGQTVSRFDSLVENPFSKKSKSNRWRKNKTQKDSNLEEISKEDDAIIISDDELVAQVLEMNHEVQQQTKNAEEDSKDIPNGDTKVDKTDVNVESNESQQSLPIDKDEEVIFVETPAEVIMIDDDESLVLNKNSKTLSSTLSSQKETVCKNDNEPESSFKSIEVDVSTTKSNSVICKTPEIIRIDSKIMYRSGTSSESDCDDDCTDKIRNSVSSNDSLTITNNGKIEKETKTRKSTKQEDTKLANIKEGENGNMNPNKQYCENVLTYVEDEDPDETNEPKKEVDISKSELAKVDFPKGKRKADSKTASLPKTEDVFDEDVMSSNPSNYEYVKLSNRQTQVLISEKGIEFLRKLSCDTGLKFKVSSTIEFIRTTYYCIIAGATDAIPNVGEIIHTFCKLNAWVPIKLMELENLSNMWVAKSMSLLNEIKFDKGSILKQMKRTHKNRIRDNSIRIQNKVSRCYIILNSILMANFEMEDGVTHLRFLKNWLKNFECQWEYVEDAIASYNYIFNNSQHYDYHYRRLEKLIS